MLLMSPDHSNWWIPVYIVASPIPLVVMLFATGPFVHSIQVVLPASARKSKEALKIFAEHPGPNTVLRLHYMKLYPWTTNKEVLFGRLRRKKPSLRNGLANLEYVQEHAVQHKGTIWYWLVQGYFGKFWVDRDQLTDRGAVPGMWDTMWKQIPMEGSKQDPEVVKAVDERARRPVAMSGRPRRQIEDARKIAEPKTLKQRA
jgi:hypothetical protein